MPFLPISPDVQPMTFFLVAGLSLVIAYTIFTLVGFGSALLASPPLAQVMPVASVIPLLALLDCGGSIARAWRARNDVVVSELRSLVPAMLVGQFFGVSALVALPAAAMAVLLGCFVIAYGLINLRRIKKPGVPLNGSVHAIRQGVFGGILGGAFGSGGFIYASYLERKLESRAEFRATQAVMIGISTAWRLILCAFGGLLDGKLFLIALLMLPAALLGGALGRHIDLRLSRERLAFVLNLLLLLSGFLLVVRHIPLL